MLSSLAPARRRLLLGLIAASIAACLAVAGFLIADRGHSTASRPVSQDTAGAVLLVPGYGGSITGLSALASKLRAAGRDVSLFEPPGDATGDLRIQAKALALTASELRRTSGLPIDVVGYSAGGVVARLWVRDYGGAEIARRIVTLGSPQHGTQLAGLAGSLLSGACPLACQQLEPGSDLLDSLNAGDETPAGPTFVSMWSSADDVVIPPSSAELAGAVNIEVQSICPAENVSHSQLPTDEVVQAMVLAELAAGPPVTLRAADCRRLGAE